MERAERASFCMRLSLGRLATAIAVELVMPDDHKLKIAYLPIGELKPDPYNPRIHTPKHVDEIANSIRTFSFTNPILIDENLAVIAGHGRLLAAKKLAMTQVPTVMVSHLNDAQKSMLQIADNQIALNGSWDADLLRIKLVSLTKLEIKQDLTVTGLSLGKIDVLLTPKSDPDDDKVPAAPAQPQTQPGDIYVCGDHRIGCGDGRDVGFLREVIGGDCTVDMAFLDPPYNVRIKGHANTTRRHREFAMASGEMTDAAFRTFLSKTLSACAAVSRDGAVHFVCMDWRHLEPLMAVGSEVYGDLINLCIWNKSNAGMGSLYRSKHELVLVYRVGNAAHLNTVELGKHGRNRTNVWDYASVNTFAGNRSGDLDLHPTVKPTAMVTDAIQDVTRRGDLVLDIFLGSGTTLIAAERCGRRFRGVEIDPAYVDVAVERWERMTGKKAQRIAAIAA
jgi:DNA modification methylase